MHKQIRGLLLVVALSSISAVAGNTPYLIAIDGIRDDEVSGRLEHNLLLIARYDGSFQPVEEWDRESGLWSLRPYLLSEFPTYGVYRYGHAIAEVAARQREARPYFCNSLVVGVEDADRAELGSTMEKIEAVTGVGGWSNGTEISYTSRSLLALGGAFDERVQQPVVGALAPDAIQLLLPEGEVSAASEQESDTGFYVATGVSSRVQVLVANRELEHGSVSRTWVRDQAGELHSLKAIENSESSWGDGYTFVDAFRLKDKGPIYLLFEVTYYEAVGYNIYELDMATGKPELVFETIAYGC